MKAGAWAEDPERLYQHSRGGVITVARLVELGVPARTCYRRCQPGRAWRLLLPGVLLLGGGEPSHRQLIDAALLYAGREAVVTGAAACRGRGLRAVPAGPMRVHLLVPHEQKVISSGFVIVERTTRMPRPHFEDGVPVAPLARAALDLCRRLRSPRAVSALLAEAVQVGRLSPAKLLEELDAGSNRGSAIPRAALQHIAAGARSVAEIDAMNVWRLSGLPEPVWNQPLRDGSGEYIGTPDGYFKKVRLAWEIDSYDFHFAKEGYAKTLDRNARYAAAGIAVLQTLPSRLRTEPEEVAAELRAAYEARQLNSTQVEDAGLGQANIPWEERK
ncbi:hypothetical protein [Amycolatopsis sp. WAC 04182]|uniref:hypothetical protein n=1 Tax=Amycolatopsis sp. WAC 04182 TaxID=2203198 RepID=UPI001F242723|nr:hypothetical protein [Amycolatopsis sp. WAC 04182]